MALDGEAKRVGRSRSEHLRRALERDRVEEAHPVTVDQLKRVASLARDLDDPDVMSGVWSCARVPNRQVSDRPPAPRHEAREQSL